jgi:hypothetical protein
LTVFNVLFAQGLTAHAGPSSPVVVDSVDPGLCLSNFRNNLKGGFGGLFDIINFFMELIFARTTEEGSRQLVYAALAKTPDEMRGKFVSFANTREPSDFVIGPLGKRAEDKLWVSSILLASDVTGMAIHVCQADTVSILSEASPEAGAIFKEYLSN